MSNNTFGIDTAFPPRSPQQGPPGYPPVPPPGYPPLPPPGQPIQRARRPRRWPLIVTAGVIGAVVASAVAATVSLQVRSSGDEPTRSAAPATVTVSVPAPTATATAPLPAAQADSQTCRQGWIPAGNLTDDAQGALRAIPSGLKLGDPQIESDPAMKAAVEQAAKSYRSAADVLAAAIAPGTTPVLLEAAHTAVNALRLLGDAYAVNAPTLGNTIDIANSAGNTVGNLCQRLAP